jgi:RNA polymerase sigma-70 factor, ECF subfamily
MHQSTGTPEGRSDSELLRAAQHDPTAFEELFERHAMPLRQWLLAQTHDGAVAHDLLAETFAQAWRDRRRFRGDDDRSGGAWLYGIARHLVYQHRKRGRIATAARKRLAMATPSGHDGGIEEIAVRIDAHQLAPAVREAFAELTPDQQRAINYRVVHELSYEEVAARLDCSTITARTRVFRGLQTLRGAIAKGAQP